MNDSDKPTVTPIARRFHEMGFKLMRDRRARRRICARAAFRRQRVFKVHEGRPNCLDMIVNGDVQLLINTPLGKHAQRDDYTLRQAAIANRVSYTTTLSAASAACDAILSLRSRQSAVRSLQEWQADISTEPRRSRRRDGMSDDVFVHESAYVDDGATIGAGTKVWHFCHVMPRRGDRRAVHPRPERRRDERHAIGNNVKIQNNVSIYEGVELEDDVFCGPSMVFTNVINPRSHVSRKNEYQRTLVRRGAIDRRERDDRLRRDARRVCVRRRGRGGDEGRSGLRADGRRAGATHRLDVPVRRAAARLGPWRRCAACGTTLRDAAAYGICAR